VAKSYVLDTSAVFAFTKAEEGSDVIEDIRVSSLEVTANGLRYTEYEG